MSEDRAGGARDSARASVGAIVFASDEPVLVKEIAEALELGISDVEDALGQLEAHFESHDLGLRIERVAGGVRLATRPEVGAFVRQFFRQRNRARLSLAALETLAIVAYRQPVTAPEIHAIRGKDPSAALKGLLERDLVRCEGRKKVVGSPMLYGTTRTFLVHFGLNDLADLPSIEEFDQFFDVLASGRSLSEAGDTEAVSDEVAEDVAEEVLVKPPTAPAPLDAPGTRDAPEASEA